MDTKKNEVIKHNSIVDIIKFIAALLVILSHSYSLSNNSKDLLAQYIEGASFGSFAVAIFFSFSGYFIMKSLLLKGGNKFLLKRLKRLLPELIIVVLITIFIVGPIFTKLSVISYFLNKKTYLYFLNAIMIPYHNLPGVFTNNIHGSTVNGALWTLPIEFICYMAIYMYYKLEFTKNKKFLLVTFLLVIVTYFSLSFLNKEFLMVITRPIIVFLFSAILCYVKRIKKRYFILSIFVSILLIVFKNSIVYDLFLIIFLPIILVYVIQNLELKSTLISFLGRISYSIYLVGFMVQQSIISLFGGTMKPYVNFLLSSLIAIMLGMMVNTFYEKVVRVKLEGLYD